MAADAVLRQTWVVTILSDLRPFLTEAIVRFGVPGASLAVLSDGVIYEAAAGVVNNETLVEATPDAVFQIGSITKLMTAAMIMQLVDEGRLDIDTPVRKVLPDFAVGDVEVSTEVTPRHLLNHSSGIDGDFFVDAGRGDGVVARLVEMGRSLPQLHTMGEGFSYCNFGFALLGRIIEVLDGMEWDTALRRRVAGRLQTEYLTTRPEQLLRWRAAIGHIASGPTGSLAPSPAPYLSFGMGPAGATATCRARDLVAFAQSFLAGGGSLVSHSAAESMRSPNTSAVNAGAVQDFGLGFMLFDWAGTQLYGHDGATVGQNAFLRIHQNGIVAALLTNGGDVQGLAHHVLTAIFEDLAHIAPPAPPEGTARLIDTTAYTGTFQRGLTRYEIDAEGPGLSLRTCPNEVWSRGLFPPLGPFALRPVDESTFAYRMPGVALPLTVRFIDPDGSGHFAALHAGLRRNPRRVSEQE